MGRTVVCLSGGKASAWVADYSLRTRSRSEVVLYFNDTRWEDPDLYRFLDDLSRYWGHPITVDSDGRTPIALAFDEGALPNNRMPFCSRVLKAERLQRFVINDDTLMFGIGLDEKHRAVRITEVYADIARKRGIDISVQFPLITQNVTSAAVDSWLASTGIRTPRLYELGFAHNNCGGRCVRQGLRGWKQLYHLLPERYAEVEAAERDWQIWHGSAHTILKGASLADLRKCIEAQTPLPFDDPDNVPSECVGICSMEN